MEEKHFSDISYEQFLNEEKLMGSRCKQCGAFFVPPRPICIKCYASEMEWVQTKGKGKLAAFTCIAVGPPFMMEEGYNRTRPYVSGVVELEEGARVVARIEGVDGSKPETIKIGTPLRAEFLHRGEGEDSATFLAFRP
ncbi:MAG: Zn-ribbon domain-containing OB-fold protein [Dehalococcoidia bacterium]|nr:MAG: Zn-ribbon domain-containing OB-fold protein [Dehalococcoidia bacterium]